MNQIRVIKIGGKVIDDEEALQLFLSDFAAIEGQKILVHGGGSSASRIAERMGLEVNMQEGRRITDQAMLDVVTMVYGGYINKNMVAKLQARGVNAAGFSGADLDLLRSDIRPKDPIDFGFVGDIKKVNGKVLATLCDEGIVPVIAPLTHDGKGQLLNSNADNMAAFIAIACTGFAHTSLTFCFEKEGVMDDDKLVKKMNKSIYSDMKAGGQIRDGMIPKLDLAFQAVESGVMDVRIKDYADLAEAGSGTEVLPE
jgi:acetylglutamate kinase